MPDRRLADACSGLENDLRRHVSYLKPYLSLVLVAGNAFQNSPVPFRTTTSSGRISNGVKAASLRYLSYNTFKFEIFSKLNRSSNLSMTKYVAWKSSM